MRTACRKLLDEAVKHVDIVLIDCAPGISVMTECWLRDPHLGFARHLGVVVNMLNAHTETDQMITDILRENAELMCFSAAVPLIPHIQKASMFKADKRSYQNKYPGDAGTAFRSITDELLRRVALKA